MARVKRITEDRYEISDFLLSLPHVTLVVEFRGDSAAVIDRTGTTETRWDAGAIRDVQKALLAGAVE